jgi:hypothetical protein
VHAEPPHLRFARLKINCNGILREPRRARREDGVGEPVVPRFRFRLFFVLLIVKTKNFVLNFRLREDALDSRGVVSTAAAIHLSS